MNQLKLTATNHKQIVDQAVKVLNDGGLIIYPTETVYGLGADATNQKAVDKLLAYKSRREGKPLSIAVSDQNMAEKYVDLNDQAEALYQQFLPGPITIISAVRHAELAVGVASEFNTLGIRIPDYPLVMDIVKALGRPITATSANASGKRRPYSIDQILSHLSEKQKNLIDLIIDAGTLPKRPPSTVIDTTLSTPVIFRQGALLKNKQSKSTKLTSRSEAETKAISGKIVLKFWDMIETAPIVIGLNGPLGAGKTVFAKGVAEFLGITVPIVSPTYSYTEEYDFSRHATKGKLIHSDVWKVDSAEMLARIGLVENLQPNTIIIIEWFSQVANWLQPALQASKATLIQINISDQDPNRGIEIIESQSFQLES